MNYKMYVLFLTVLLMACSDQKLTHTQVVTKYYGAFDSASYNEIRELIADTIAIASGDYVTPYDKVGFYEFFKWDSIFDPSYEIIELREMDNTIVVTLSQDNIRNEFLQNNPLVFRVEVFFDSGKISKLEELEYIHVDWGTWSKERDALVNWIKENHPELDGFVNDMSMQGSKNYLKAIEMYTARKSDF